MKNIMNKITEKAKKDVTPYLHLVFGSIHNLIITLVLGAILLHGFKLNTTITKVIVLILCLPILIWWEIRQKKNGGENNWKEQLRDIVLGWISAPFIVIPYIELMNE